MPKEITKKNSIIFLYFTFYSDVQANSPPPPPPPPFKSQRDFITRDALKGHTVSKNGSISFFFFFLVATNQYINLCIKLSPLLLGMYCSDCLQQKQANQNPFLSLISRGRGPTHPYLCDVNASFDFFIKTALNCGAILLTCSGLKCAVLKRKFHHFEAVNRKNNF